MVVYVRFSPTVPVSGPDGASATFGILSNTSKVWTGDTADSIDVWVEHLALAVTS
jgi:hypothetical protein